MIDDTKGRRNDPPLSIRWSSLIAHDYIQVTSASLRLAMTTYYFIHRIVSSHVFLPSHFTNKNIDQSLRQINGSI